MMVKVAHASIVTLRRSRSLVSCNQRSCQGCAMMMVLWSLPSCLQLAIEVGLVMELYCHRCEYLFDFKACRRFARRQTARCRELPSSLGLQKGGTNAQPGLNSSPRGSIAPTSARRLMPLAETQRQNDKNKVISPRRLASTPRCWVRVSPYHHVSSSPDHPKVDLYATSDDVAKRLRIGKTTSGIVN